MGHFLSCPEPRLDPPEDKVAFYCHECGGEIYVSENYYELGGNNYCEHCIRDAFKTEAGVDW